MYDLNFFANPLREDFIIPNNETSVSFSEPNAPLFWTYIKQDAEAIVHKDIVAWAKENNLRIHTLNIFKTAPHFTPGIHIDGDVHYLLPAINWVLTGHNSEQIYYKPIQGLAIKDCFIASKETETTKDYYRTFDESKLVEIERKNIIGPTLVRINIPHRVANYDNEWRITVSLRFERMSGQPWEWLDILKLFKNYIK